LSSFLAGGLLFHSTGIALGAEKASAAFTFKARDLAGTTLDLKDLLQKGPVLLDFWATWCKPCAASLPEIEALYKRYGPRGLSVIGISIDGPRNYAKVRPFVARAGLTYSMVLDEDGNLQQSYRITAVPTAVLIDGSGAVLRVRQGYRPGEGKLLEADIRSLLPSEDSPPPGSDGKSSLVSPGR
jgi:thiol-disulfide isomerase/thioredoxin